MHIITKNDSYYPQQLKFSKESPESFFFEGDLELLKGSFISVVGSRNLSSWAQLWMEQELLPVLKSMNIGVVSGGARGADQMAHSLALRAGVPTLVVLPSGIERKYPKSIESFVNPLTGFISEYQSHEGMRRYYFPQRNRIIAALSPLTMVIQAAQKSGSMITARLALENGRSVACLPSHPLDILSSGNLQILFDGAYMVRDFQDLVSLIEKHRSEF